MDALEPIKFFKDEKPKCVLDNIIFEVQKSEKSIKVFIKESTEGRFDFAEWYDSKIKSIPEWLENTNTTFQDNIIGVLINL